MPVKYSGRARCQPPADLERVKGGTAGGSTSSPGWGAQLQVGEGSTDASDVPQHAGRLPALLASRSRGCQPLSRILAVFGVFHAKIHSEGKRLHRLHLAGTTGSPSGARMPCPPKTAFGPHPKACRPHTAPIPAPGPSTPALALLSPNPIPNYFHFLQLLVSPHSRVSPPNSPAPSAQM